ALIQEDVGFRDLGLVVVDEQHRFGVEQRASLRQKGLNPHMLVMTATPIPRTLSLTLYGDLDLSTLDELPPGRQPIMTYWREPLDRERTYEFVRTQVKLGRQAFIICPLVEESDKLEAKAAVDEHARLERDVFPDLKIGLLHGRMKGKEKDEVMRAFLNREYDILVSTSVVEVGIDVPNATVMLVEGANRFGLSQLHQFRGRVGRGAHESYCFLLADTNSEESAQRLNAIVRTQDGFQLAEEDLKLRGPGEFFGTRQSGLPDLKVAKLSDVKVLEDARREAQDLFARDPELSQPEHQPLAQKVRTFWRGEGDLS
ncbi:MAG: DNA helicase RecG, partial [Chloroflexi bacterium]|nr:DNA helicase RecG [Chloroflexota bacterium]